MSISAELSLFCNEYRFIRPLPLLEIPIISIFFLRKIMPRVRFRAPFRVNLAICPVVPKMSARDALWSRPLLSPICCAYLDLAPFPLLYTHVSDVLVSTAMGLSLTIASQLFWTWSFMMTATIPRRFKLRWISNILALFPNYLHLCFPFVADDFSVSCTFWEFEAAFASWWRLKRAPTSIIFVTIWLLSVL